MTVAISMRSPSLPDRTTVRFSLALTARMPACGGFRMAENVFTPNMPMLEIENPPPWNSSGRRRPSRARAIRPRALVADLAQATSSRPDRTIGVISPSGIDTATAMSTSSYSIMASSV